MEYSPIFIDLPDEIMRQVQDTLSRMRDIADDQGGTEWVEACQAALAALDQAQPYVHEADRVLFEHFREMIAHPGRPWQSGLA